MLIVDDHPVVRTAVRQLVDTHPGWTVCGEAADVRTALDLALKDKPDVAIVDVRLPDEGGVGLTRRLRAAGSDTRVLFFTMHDDGETVAAAVEAGARGYVLKSDGEEDLQAGLSAMQAGRTYFSPRVAELLIEPAFREQRRSRLATFTPRELEVAQRIAEGDGNRKIAERLDLSIKTVESHRAAAMRKAGATSGAELVRFLVKNGLVRP